MIRLCKCNDLTFLYTKKHFTFFVDVKWTDLKAPCEDRIKCLEDLKAFQQAHDSLGSWLSQKEKLMGVLGPIATEPGMLDNQTQQVKVSSTSCSVYYL